MNFGGGADTIQPPRSGSRSHLSSSEHSTWSSEPSGGRDEVDVNRQLQEKGIIREAGIEGVASGLAQRMSRWSR